MSKEEKESTLKEEIQCANSKFQSSLVLAIIGTFTLTASLLALLVDFDFYLRRGFSLSDAKTAINVMGIVAGIAFSIGGFIRAYYLNKKKKELVNQSRLFDT